MKNIFFTKADLFDLGQQVDLYKKTHGSAEEKKMTWGQDIPHPRLFVPYIYFINFSWSTDQV